MIKLRNSLTDQIEDFIPNDPNYIKIYSCGPTIYNHVHIGNIRSLLVTDIIHRIMAFLYPSVKCVMNITDIDDKIIQKALETQQDPYIMTKYYEEEFLKICNVINIKDLKFVKATEAIDNMLKFINTLDVKGYIYTIPQDGLYFDTAKDKEYGRIYKNIKKIEFQGKGNINNKRNLNDFALWKFDNGIMSYPSPWGQGRPGWHLECSTMSGSELGSIFDLHLGGVDLKFPHHENELTQNIAYNGYISNKYWVHTNMLSIGNDKMSKSVGNIILGKDILRDQDGNLNGLKGDYLRYLLLSTKYDQILKFNDKRYEDSVKAIDKIYKHTNNIDTNYQISHDDIKPLLNNLNTYGIFVDIHKWIKEKEYSKVYYVMKLLGFKIHHN